MKQWEAKSVRVGQALAVVAAVAAVGVAAASGSAATAKSSSKKLTIGLASEGLTAAFPVAIANGVRAEAKKYGVKSIVLDGKLTETTQESDVRTLIAEHVSGILIDVIDAGPTGAMVKLANAAHIPVMLVHGYAGAKAKPAYPGVSFEVDENETSAGKEAGQMALKADPSGGEIAIITGTPGYQAVAQRENGFLSVTKPTGKYQVVATQSGNWISTGGYSSCASILQAHPDIKLFYTESDDMAIGCVRAIKAASSSAKVVSIGGETPVKNLIKQGSVYGTICYEPKTEGEIALTAMYKLLTKAAHYNRTVDFYATPAVTKANVSDCGYQW